VEFDRLEEVPERLADRFKADTAKFRRPAQVMIVGTHVLRRLALGPLEFLALESRCDSDHDAGSNAVLKIEYVFEGAIEMIGPEMRTILGIDELARNAHPRSGLAHAAFQHIADAEVATDLFDVHGTALVGEARISRDHEEPGKTR